MNEQLKHMNESATHSKIYFISRYDIILYRLNTALSEEQYRYLSSRKEIETARQEMSTAENEISTMEQLLFLTGFIDLSPFLRY